MEKIAFNDGWQCYRTDGSSEPIQVTVPHDAMQLDKRSATCPGGVNNGWIDAGDYTYVKEFFVPDSYQGQKVRLEFEGVYHKATVTFNDVKLAEHNSGYTSFMVDLEGVLKYGEKNTIIVTAVGSDQPNSRWYTGTGIYRPVWLYVKPPVAIKWGGIKITPLAYKEPKVRLDIQTTDPGKLKVEILEWPSRDLVKRFEVETTGNYREELSLSEAKLWSCESPNLYVCQVTYQNGEICDIREERFGIRIITCDSERGFCLNGERVILRGGCVHHDNGILGACAYDYAERRKVQILKDNGFNALRSAHNPCSKALLNACDELGMLMVDEYVDVWYIHKSKYDYASEVEKNFASDFARIVEKDYNHPSVIMYSTGNEVSETAQPKGIALCDKMTKRFHELDSTRPVTCGINIFFNFLSSIGFGVYSDKKAEKELANVKKKKAVGSEFYNNVAGVFGSEFMKTGATLYPCDVKTRDAYARMDVAGYNYGIKRYQKDLAKYPERIILGTETFCSDAYKFYEQAKKNKRIIGDFVWSAMDYLGEVGVGAWEYQEYAKNFSNDLGWVAAGSGRIDLTGKPLAEMAYMQVAYELKKIAIGVVPVPFTKEKHSPSAWKMSNAISSWSFNGCEGMEAQIEVYARADSVSLFLNGNCVGRKHVKDDCKAIFKTTYQNGTLRAIAYDAQGKIIAETELSTAEENTVLTLEPEKVVVNREEQELAYVRLKYTDTKGEVKPLLRSEIKVSVVGGKLIGLGSACPFYETSYQGEVTDTYYGEAMAIIKPGKDDYITVFAKSELGEGSVKIGVE